MSSLATIDPVTLTVIDNYCTSTCRDMGVTMMTTAYSPIFNESLDFSCVIFDPAGQMLAQAEFCPSQIGTIKFTVAWTIAELGADSFREGDVVLHNDPYRGSGHVPEHMLLKPVFWEGELVAFVANVAHMSEIGAKTPGGLSGDATEIFQEGLLIPPVKIVDQGRDVGDIWKMVLSHQRTPRVTFGDFRAMLGSLDLAERRMHALKAAAAELIAPHREVALADQLALTISGGDVIADFTGSASQATGPVNAIYAVTASAIYNAFLHLTDPTIPRNEGCYRPFTVIAPPGTIVNCAFPAPVAGGNTETSPRITDMVFGALAEAIPDRVAAACGGTSSPFLFGGIDEGTGDPYAHFHFEGVGWGGRSGEDGNDMVVTINGNCRNTPVEVFETRYRAFRIESYRLVADSGGPGEFRGGLGGERIFTVTVPEVTVSALLNRMKTEPWGVLGGGGAVGGLWVRRAGQERWRTFVEEFGVRSPSKFSGVTLHAGDQVKILMPGGGGYGDPSNRDEERVRRDVAEGFVSAEAAGRDYGLNPAGGDRG